MIYSTRGRSVPDIPTPTSARYIGRSVVCAGRGAECMAMLAGVMPRDTRPRHTRKYEPLYAPARRQPPPLLPPVRDPPHPTRVRTSERGIMSGSDAPF